MRRQNMSPAERQAMIRASMIDNLEAKLAEDRQYCRMAGARAVTCRYRNTWTRAKLPFDRAIAAFALGKERPGLNEMA